MKLMKGLVEFLIDAVVIVKERVHENKENSDNIES